MFFSFFRRFAAASQRQCLKIRHLLCRDLTPLLTIDIQETENNLFSSYVIFSFSYMYYIYAIMRCFFVQIRVIFHRNVLCSGYYNTIVLVQVSDGSDYSHKIASMYRLTGKIVLRRIVCT